MFAAGQGDNASVELLLESAIGIDVNAVVAPEQSGYKPQKIVEGTQKKVLKINPVTALQIAAANQHPSTCQLLLEHHADPTVCNHSHENCLHIAAAVGNATVAQVILQEVSKNHSVKNTLLNDESTNGFTPLMKACLSSSPAVVSVLLKFGADVKYSNIRCGGMTVLHAALRNGDEFVVKELMQQPGIQAVMNSCWTVGGKRLSNRVLAVETHNERVSFL